LIQSESSGPDPTPSKDKMMWELHEIRHKLHKERKNKTIEEINIDALKKYSAMGWKMCCQSGN